MSAHSFPPAGTTDCHTHLVGDPARYPMVAPRAYTPLGITPEDMRAMLKRSGVSRVVVVQISVFGTDNSCMLDGMRVLGACARGVVQVDAATPNAALDQMHADGVRGVRVNLDTSGVTDPAEAKRLLSDAAKRCERNGWHLQVYTSPPVIEALERALGELPVPVVIDHFGLLSVQTRGGAAETAVRRLLASGKGWVKISARYRLDQPEALDQVGALARDLYSANPEQIVWGSDWPHPPQHNSKPSLDPRQQPYRDLDPKALLADVPAWFDQSGDQQRILVDNPARLYDFDPA